MENKFKIFVIVALVVLALAIGGSTVLVIHMMQNNKAEMVIEVNENPTLKTIQLGEPILTNITNDNGNLQHFAKVQLSIGVVATNEDAFEALKTKISENQESVRNELISAIGEQTYSMLNATNGKEKLADEIITRLNTLLDTELINKVYYTDYFIQ